MTFRAKFLPILAKGVSNEKLEKAGMLHETSKGMEGKMGNVQQGMEMDGMKMDGMDMKGGSSKMDMKSGSSKSKNGRNENGRDG